MDQPGLEAAQHHAALRGLARINWISNSDGILWGPIRRLAEEKRGQPLRVLDIATGAGDVPIRLHRRAHRAGLSIQFSGADVSHTALAYARGQAETCSEFFVFDALRQPLPTDYDVITCSLFLHHLDMDEAIGLMRRMGEAARRLVLINDLIRSPTGLMLAYVGTRVLSRSPVVHADGPQSVRAAFTIAEARQLAAQAGWNGASVSWRWPFRFLLEWRRPT